MHKFVHKNEQKSINSPSNKGDKRTSSSVSIDHLIWVEVCTRQSTSVQTCLHGE